MKSLSMQFFKKIKQHKNFLLFIFLFGYAHSIQIRFLIRQKISWYLFTPEAAIMTVLLHHAYPYKKMAKEHLF